jgi:hydroxymethylglutaryl-CoA reductase
VQLTGIKDPSRAKHTILERKQEIIDLANLQDPMLIKLGGGAKDLEVRIVNTQKGPNVVVHLLVDVKDAMGANAVNTMAEAVAPLVERIAGGRVYLRILGHALSGTRRRLAARRSSTASLKRISLRTRTRIAARPTTRGS